MLHFRIFLWATSSSNDQEEGQFLSFILDSCLPVEISSPLEDSGTVRNNLENLRRHLVSIVAPSSHCPPKHLRFCRQNISVWLGKIFPL
jgi:hypothetical protein